MLRHTLYYIIVSVLLISGCGSTQTFQLIVREGMPLDQIRDQARYNNLGGLDEVGPHPELPDVIQWRTGIRSRELRYEVNSGVDPNAKDVYYTYQEKFISQETLDRMLALQRRMVENIKAENRRREEEKRIIRMKIIDDLTEQKEVAWKNIKEQENKSYNKVYNKALSLLKSSKEPRYNIGVSGNKYYAYKSINSRQGILNVQVSCATRFDYKEMWGKLTEYTVLDIALNTIGIKKRESQYSLANSLAKFLPGDESSDSFAIHEGRLSRAVPYVYLVDGTWVPKSSIEGKEDKREILFDCMTSPEKDKCINNLDIRYVYDNFQSHFRLYIDTQKGPLYYEINIADPAIKQLLNTCR